MRRNGRIPKPPIQRVMTKILINPFTGCWLYTGTVNNNGYPRIIQADSPRNLGAHRVTYEHYRQTIPAGLDLDHLCRVRRCVNPWHLEPVTRSMNNLRGLRKTLQSTCKNGHPFDGFSQGMRICKTCRRESARRYKARLKAQRERAAS